MGTEERLAESERRFRLLIESIPHHVWSFHVDGSLGYWNQRLVDYTGLTEEELRRGGWEALHPGDVERVKAAWQVALPKVRGGTARTWPRWPLSSFCLSPDSSEERARPNGRVVWHQHRC